MNETQVTIVGGITADPERRAAGQTPVASFRVASTPRRFDRQSNEWRDGETTYWACEAFGQLAEAILGEYRKGAQVVLVGTVDSQSWNDKTSGEARTKLVVKVSVIGTKLRIGSSQSTSASEAWQQPSAAQQPQSTPWETAQPGARPQYDDTPF
jgi:single-strand DNA-binding protein